ncbi:16S rRNA 2'-O-ribose C1402 methyltransferase [Gammaproteobacteria bacterium]
MGKQGTLYIVATPIGNLGDMTQRAIEVLCQVDCIAAEDTRHSAPLLRHFEINQTLVAYHEHNEREMTEALLTRLQNGQSIALITDAGTPLISDPGFQLVRAARKMGISVTPIPGPSALTCALSVSGLPCDRFIFEGFLPAKAIARRSHLESLRTETRTIVFYESPHRVQETLADLVAIFGKERHAVLARELTKIHEVVHSGTLVDLVALVDSDPNQRKGEFVLLMEGSSKMEDTGHQEAKRVLKILLQEVSTRQAVELATKIVGIRKNVLYELALDSFEKKQ